MDKSNSVPLRCLLVVVVLLGAAVHGTWAVTCNPDELSSCLEAIIGSQSPSTECCKNLKAQKSCLCGYLKNPSYAQYLDSPKAKKVASACGVSVPSC